MKFRTNQSGAAHIVAILLVVLIAAVGVVGWKVWDNNKKTSNIDSAPQSQSETDAAPTSSANKLEIAQWRVQFDIPSTIPDLKVDAFNDYPGNDGQTPSQTVELDSPTLEAEGKIKTTGTQERMQKLGKILRQKSNTDYYSGTTIEEYAEVNKYASVVVGAYTYVYITNNASENADEYLNAIKQSILTSFASID